MPGLGIFSGCLLFFLNAYEALRVSRVRPSPSMPLLASKKDVSTPFDEAYWNRPGVITILRSSDIMTVLNSCYLILGLG